MPVPSSSEKSVTVSEYTGWPSSSTNRCRIGDLDQHEAGAQRAEVDQPARPPAGRSPPATTSGPRTNAATSAAEIPISVSSALRPLPNSIDRPNATSN